MSLFRANFESGLSRVFTDNLSRRFCELSSGGGGGGGVQVEKRNNIPASYISKLSL